MTRSVGSLVLIGILASIACARSSDPARADQAKRIANTNSIGMVLVRIPAGEFVMGSPSTEPGRQLNEGPAHPVTISRDFELAVHEVTNAQFRVFVEATGYQTEAERDVEGGFGIDFERARVVQDADIDWRNPGFPGVKPQDDHPVLMISWADADAFCTWLSDKEGRRYRLPTEAEWEYAARGGTNSAWWTGDDPSALADTANTADAALLEAMPRATWSSTFDDGFAFVAPVGSYRPNPFGLFDMHGNVWEWCEDWHDESAYAQTMSGDPRGPASGRFRSIRGGGWFNGAAQNRSAQRIYFAPTFRYCLLSGFRVVREVN